MEEVKGMIEEVTKEIEDVMDDRDVPRNVREKLEKAKKMIEEEKEKKEECQEEEEKEEEECSQNLDLTRAIYLMNEASEDINIPFHTRTDIMNITSKLEEIKENVK